MARRVILCVFLEIKVIAKAMKWGLLKGGHSDAAPSKHHEFIMIPQKKMLTEEVRSIPRPVDMDKVRNHELVLYYISSSRNC